MYRDIAKSLVTKEQIADRVKEMGLQISQDYQGKELLVIGILKGAVVFMADLIRYITVPLNIDFMAVSSYGSTTESSGVVRINKDLEQAIDNKHILIVEDIIDSGLTLKYLIEILRSRGPASIKVCTLLDKPERRKTEVQVNYNGFTIPDEFVVGYGLDYDERYRHLPEICVLKEEVYNS